MVYKVYTKIDADCSSYVCCVHLKREEIHIAGIFNSAYCHVKSRIHIQPSSVAVVLGKLRSDYENIHKMFLKTKQSGKKQKQTTQPFLPVSLNKLLLKKKNAIRLASPKCVPAMNSTFTVYIAIYYTPTTAIFVEFCGISGSACRPTPPNLRP